MLTVAPVDVWSAVIEDRPGGLKEKLEKLMLADANLDFLIARRLHEEQGRAIVFLTPLCGQRQLEAAEQAGFHRDDSMHTLRIDGPDEPGIAYRITAALAEAGINLRGVSAARMGSEFAMFLSFDTRRDAQEADQRLKLPL